MNKVTMQRRKLLVGGLTAVAGMFALAGCATMGTLLPSSVSQSRESLEQAVKAKTLGTWRYNDLLGLKVSGVQLVLLPRTQRFGLRLEVEILESVFDKRWPGVVTLESAVRFDAQKNQIVLAEPSLEQLEFTGLPKSVSTVAKALAAQLLIPRLNGVVVYQVSESVARGLATFSIRPGAIKIEENQISLELIAQK